MRRKFEFVLTVFNDCEVTPGQGGKREGVSLVDGKGRLLLVFPKFTISLRIKCYIKRQHIDNIEKEYGNLMSSVFIIIKLKLSKVFGHCNKLKRNVGLKLHKAPLEHICSSYIKRVWCRSAFENWPFIIKHFYLVISLCK